jgi:hypothetical protein
MAKHDGEVRDVPFLGNDLKGDQQPTTGKPTDTSDAPGKADSEMAEEIRSEDTGCQ